MKRTPKPAPAFTLRPGESITFVLPVVPRTKKNSRTHVRKRAKTGNMITVPLPSDAYREMEKKLFCGCRRYWCFTTPNEPITQPTPKLEPEQRPNVPPRLW